MNKIELSLFKDIYTKKKELDFLVDDTREKGIIGDHYIDILGIKVDIIILVNQSSEYHKGPKVKDFSDISKNEPFKKWFKDLQEQNKEKVEKEINFEA